jgi:ribosomal-protein-alanine N-acetyltransferase
MTELRTERLRLVPCPGEPERDALSSTLGIVVPSDWPVAELAEFLPVYAQLLARDPAVLGWGPWLVVERESDTLVADAGFLGKPDEAGTVEIGYSVLPAFRRRGYAIEAAGALVGWALAQPGVARVVARCDPDNVPSIRVLERIGMRRTGERDGQLAWARERPTSSA